MLRFSWEWDLSASPEALWPLVSDSDRFNRDTGIPQLVQKGEGPDRVIAFRKFGYTVRWREEPFEWSRPGRFGVARHYLSGPLREMKVSVQLVALPSGGTRLRYHTDLEARHPLLLPILSLGFRLAIKRKFTAVFRAYDRAALAASGADAVPSSALARAVPAPERTFAPSGRARLAARFQDLLQAGADPVLAARIRLLLEDGDDSELIRIRPYMMADAWRTGRRQTLEACLLAARTGLLDFRWDLLCPSCRGAKFTASHLKDIKGPIHCEACHIDFRAAFDRSVEVTFAANRSIRAPEAGEYCVGSPQRTPHVHLRQTLEPGKAMTVDLSLQPGRYRLRSPSLEGAWHITASEDGEAHAHAEPRAAGWPEGEAAWSIRPRLSLANPTGRRVAFILERNAWADDAATAAEVTALQSFRDLFADEALRPGEEISVGSLAFLFTDLRGSTRLYREAGDAKAFGLVMEHFDILKSVIAEEGGAVVKTIGDAVMAVFPRPQSAVRAALESHRRLRESQPLLILKTGVHCGSCIAVNQNDRLDYFGSTLNLSARLLGFSEGGDLVVTRDAGRDPETAAWLKAHGPDFRIDDLHTPIRGFDQEAFHLMRITPLPPVAPAVPATPGEPATAGYPDPAIP
jgi:class 3 adenylate cyclase